MKKKDIIAFLAIFANLFLAIGKVIVGIISKSASILADGINSATDVISSTISLIGIKWAEKPADERHPYGHAKAEVIAGFLITIIIFLSGGWIIIDAIKSFFLESTLQVNYLAFIIMGISAFVNAIMSQLKIHYGKKHNSVSLISDGLHSRIDLLVSLGIFISLFFIRYYPKIDSIIALLVGIYILIESFKLGSETTLSLMGAKADEETENKIKEILKKERIELVNLKTQSLGSKAFAEITIKLPAKLKVEEAETLTKKIEKKLISKIENLAYTTIQIKSHNTGLGYYKPSIGKGFGWKRHGKFKKEIPEAKGKGPEGYCTCPKCNYKIKHKRGKPCSTIKCPKCGKEMKRE